MISYVRTYSWTGVVAHTFNLSTWEAKAGEFQLCEFQGQPILHSKFQVNQGYIVRLCLEINMLIKIKYTACQVSIFAFMLLIFLFILRLVEAMCLSEGACILHFILVFEGIF